MNVPISWLKEYVDLTCDVKEFDHKMTMSGSKVETTEYLGKEISGVVVGKILFIERHPDADKLVITKVDIGSEILQIVTGADNLTQGDYVPVAVSGSTLAGGLKIKKGKLRGVESNGMLCSIQELGYTVHDYPEAAEDGIYIFPEPQPLGGDVKNILMLEDQVVEFEITSDRADCFSVIGIAREAAVTFGKTLAFPSTNVKEEAGGSADEYISVEIKNPDKCIRYAARVVKNVKIEPSPLWMRHRLTACGVRPINNIVDITNYVMLELGQPMHAFDIDNIDQRKIIVRDAYDGEKFVTLDEEERTLDQSMLVISDPSKAVAIGGVMGGENSKVTGEATAILLESANFYGPNIRSTSKKLGLRTDSSGKYEKGIDPNLCELAVNRAAHLIEELGAGEIVKGIVDVYPVKRERVKVEYSPERINTLLGTDISAQDMEKYLHSLEIEAENGIAVPPTFRPDLESEADIAEEVARIYGYDNIKSTLATGTATVGKKSLGQQTEELVKRTMISMGYCEAMTYSFESPKVFDKLLLGEDSPVREAVKIINPLGEDFSVMRTISINGILQSLSLNYNRRNEEAALFEVAKIYKPSEGSLPSEPSMLTIGQYGSQDFFDLKGTVEILFSTLNIEGVEYVKKNNIPYMHPGRCARLVKDKIEIGYIGEVHPQVCENYEIGKSALLAVISMDVLIGLVSFERQYKALPKFPGIRRDIAMLVRDDIPVGDIDKVIKESGGKLLEQVTLFDVYRGNQIVEGYKSVAYAVFFRAADRTLTEDEASSSVNKILNNLESRFDAKLRK